MTSKFEFWGDLPNEMRAECIKRMNFKTRMQLRGASKQDKLLVESVPKYHFDSVTVGLSRHHSCVFAKKSGEKMQFYPRRMEIPPPNIFEQARRLFINILKFSTANGLYFVSYFETDEAVSKFLADFYEYAPFRFKVVYLCCNKLEIVKFWLNNCTLAETIRITNPSFVFYGAEVMDILQLPTVINAKRLEFEGLNATEITHHFINKWVDKEKLEAEKLIDFSAGEPQNLDFLAEKFQNRVVSKTDKTLLIRTNDSTKHILIKDVLNQGKWGVYSLVVVNSFDQK